MSDAEFGRLRKMYHCWHNDDVLTFAEFQKHFGDAVAGGSDKGLMRESMAIDDHGQRAKEAAKRVDERAARGARRMTAEQADKILHEKLVMKSTVRQAFKSFDTDHDGEISPTEFRTMVERSLSVPPSLAQPCVLCAHQPVCAQPRAPATMAD